MKNFTVIVTKKQKKNIFVKIVFIVCILNNNSVIFYLYIYLYIFYITKYYILNLMSKNV